MLQYIYIYIYIHSSTSQDFVKPSMRRQAHAPTSTPSPPMTDMIILSTLILVRAERL